MGKHNWEYNYEGKTYRLQTLGEFVGESKFYYLNTPANLDINRKCGVWKQINENNFVFVWSKYARKLHCMREK
jgi:hypothetical protein